MLQMGCISSSYTRHMHQRQRSEGRPSRCQVFSTHRWRSLYKCNVRLQVRRLPKMVPALWRERRWNQADQERSGIAFRRVGASVQPRRRHQHRLFVAGRRSAVLLPRGPHEPVGVAQLCGMSPIPSGPQSTSAKYCLVITLRLHHVIIVYWTIYASCLCAIKLVFCKLTFILLHVGINKQSKLLRVTISKSMHQYIQCLQLDCSRSWAYLHLYF